MSDLVYQNYNNRCQGWSAPSSLTGPQINSLSGYQSPAGSSTVVSISGVNFFSYSTIRFGTFTPTTYFINSNIIQFYIPNTLSSGTFPVQVFNGSIPSNIVTYTIDNASGYWMFNSNNGTISNSNSSIVDPSIGGGLTVKGNINQILQQPSNTSFGTNSLPIGATGIDNTIIGNNCGNNITTGQENTFVGQQSGISNTSGIQNTFLGQQTGWSNIIGSCNVYIGEHSGYNAIGNNNTCVGQDSGSNISTGSYNTCIGQGSNMSGSGILSNSTAIGYGATITNSNQIVLGTTAETVYIPSTLTASPYALQVDGSVNIVGVCNAGSFNPPSDYRIKDIIEHITLDKDEYIIDNLKPVKYFNNLTKNVEIGFIAHEVQEIFPYLVIGEKDATELQRLNYNSLLGILVKEIQNLKTRN